MEWRFSLMEGRGWLNVREVQGRAECKGELPDDKRGLYKGWLSGAGGRALLGTFVPEADVLRLSRTVSVTELERQGAWPPVGADAVLAYSFQRERRERPVPSGWTRVSNPARLMGEPLLVQALGNANALLHKDEQGFLLAIYFRTDRPFPLTPLFCFARIMELDGTVYAVFPFRHSGCPRVE